MEGDMHMYQGSYELCQYFLCYVTMGWLPLRTRAFAVQLGISQNRHFQWLMKHKYGESGNYWLLLYSVLHRDQRDEILNTGISVMDLNFQGVTKCQACHLLFGIHGVLSILYVF